MLHLSQVPGARCQVRGGCWAPVLLPSAKQHHSPHLTPASRGRVTTSAPTARWSLHLNPTPVLAHMAFPALHPTRVPARRGGGRRGCGARRGDACGLPGEPSPTDGSAASMTLLGSSCQGSACEHITSTGSSCHKCQNLWLSLPGNMTSCAPSTLPARSLQHLPGRPRCHSGEAVQGSQSSGWASANMPQATGKEVTHGRRFQYIELGGPGDGDATPLKDPDKYYVY